MRDKPTQTCTVAALQRAYVRAAQLGSVTDAERMVALRCARRRTEALRRLTRDSAARSGIG